MSTDNVDRSPLEWLVKIPGIDPDPGETVKGYDEYIKASVSSGAAKSYVGIGVDTTGATIQPTAQPISITWNSLHTAAKVNNANSGELDKTIKILHFKQYKKKAFLEGEWEITKPFVQTNGRTSIITSYIEYKEEIHSPGGGTTAKSSWNFRDNEEA